MKLKAIIIDDEIHCIDTLSWQLQKYAQDVTLSGTFQKPSEAISFIKQNPVDVLFLDIEMPEMNGFELLQQVPDVNFDVIFTTAYDEFAIKAFAASAIDYLLKPISKDLLIAAIQKVVAKSKPILLPQQVEILYGALNNKPTRKRIAVPTQDGLNFIKLSEILYCISDSNYTEIYFDDGTKLLVSKTLKEIESLLMISNFLRIHHSHLINLGKISKYIRGDGGYVVMDNNKALSVSRSRKEALLSAFEI